MTAITLLSKATKQFLKLVNKNQTKFLVKQQINLNYFGFHMHRFCHRLPFCCAALAVGSENIAGISQCTFGDSPPAEEINATFWFSIL